MFRRFSVKTLAMFLALTMLISVLPMYVFSTESGSVRTYAEFMENLKTLEVYAEDYAAQLRKDPGELILNFIRTGVDRYKDDSWETIAGAEIVGFTNFVAAKDEENGTTAMNLRDIVIDNFLLPNRNQADFGHMFGTMNISYVAKGSADLSGWAGDLCDLLNYCVYDVSVPNGTVEEMAAYIRENCFGVNADDAFGKDDFYGDMDGYYLISEYKKGNGSFSELMEAYFTAELDDVARSVYFVNNRFAVEDSQAAVRKAIYESYSSDVAIKLLESGRGLTSYNALREACCYAFADYLYENARGQLVEGSGSGSDADNDYYTVFSSESSVLAPGISQKINYAQTVDGKQIVYYVATVDITRDDVTVKANYKDNDPSKGWGYQRVQDQADAMIKNHADDYENFSVIVATNADGYNMSTGEPGGLLVMDGKEWHAVDGDGFFGIMEDNGEEIAIIGTKEDYEIYKDKITEAVGGFGAVLVKDGKINVTKNANYAATRASRTAVGIKADGSVVMMVLDGRQLPFSAGGAMEEIAQIMLDAGCVNAINLDGGGSTTFLSKPAGSDTLQLTNRPSDGFARSVSTSLVAVSTAAPSNQFHEAIVSSEYDYITSGASMQIDVIGVSNTGNSAPIPEGSYWRVSDESMGSIDEDGVFTAAGYVEEPVTGDVTVEYVVNGVVKGQKTLHIVIPDAIKFAQERIVAIYGVPTDIDVSLWYEGSPVAFNPEYDVFVGELIPEPAEGQEPRPFAGEFNGLIFIGDESSGIRSTLIGAQFVGNYDLIALATINLYMENEALFDFDNADMGNRTLAWNREVVNARTADNHLYRIVDPNKDITMSYTFALDMTTISIPVQLEPLQTMLPGADAENASAWNFLLQLAERVCELTTVTITADFSPDLEVNIDELEIINDYFTLSSAKLDENNRLVVVCNWIDQAAAIDPATANPLCILNGITAKVKEDAAYDNKELLISNNGHVTYDVYLAASQLYNFVTNETNNAQAVYGLYPYEHVPACRTDGNDKGGHFSSQYTDFADIYVINSEIRQGWIEDSYYVDNEAVTGIQYIPSRENRYKKNFYEFDDDGVLIQPLSGFITYEDGLYYAKNGVPQIRWVSITENGKQLNYYFDPETCKAVDGVQQINEGIIFTYTFENNILVRGDLRPHSYTDDNGNLHTGIGYRWAGQWLHGQWIEVDGNSYYLPKYTYVVATGVNYWSSAAQDIPYTGYYLFDENGVFMDDRPYIVNDLYFEDGMAHTYVWRLVEVDGYYYYVNGGNLKIVKNATYTFEKGNVLNLPAGYYTFGADGRMTTDVVKVDVAANISGVTADVDGGRVVTVTATENAPVCKVGYWDADLNKYVVIEAERNSDGTYKFAAPKSAANVKVVVAGDMNGDGVFSAADKAELAKALLPRSTTELTAEQIFAMDFNNNGKLNSADKTLIARSLLPDGHRLKIDLEW